jgi:hypothetical protein
MYGICVDDYIFTDYSPWGCVKSWEFFTQSYPHTQTQVLMQSFHCCCPISNKIGISKKILVKLPKIEFHDRPTDMVKLTGSFSATLMNHISTGLQTDTKLN